MTVEVEDQTDIWNCENCGRDFRVEPGEDPHGPDGVVWCRRCRPSY